MIRDCYGLTRSLPLSVLTRSKRGIKLLRQSPAQGQLPAGFTSAGNGLGGILMLSNKSGRLGSKRGKSLIKYLATPSLFALMPSTMHLASS